MSGKNNPHWIGGKIKKCGCIFIWKPNHPNADKRGYIAESRLIAEKAFGRYLKKNEIVHHINEDPSDNRNCNLLICRKVIILIIYIEKKDG